MIFSEAPILSATMPEGRAIQAHIIAAFMVANAVTLCYLILQFFFKISYALPWNLVLLLIWPNLSVTNMALCLQQRPRRPSHHFGRWYREFCRTLGILGHNGLCRQAQRIVRPSLSSVDTTGHYWTP